MKDKRGTVRNVTLRPLVDQFIRERAEEQQTSLANTLNLAVMETPGFSEWVFKGKNRNLAKEVVRLEQVCDAYRTKLEELENV